MASKIITWSLVLLAGLGTALALMPGAYLGLAAANFGADACCNLEDENCARAALAVFGLPVLFLAIAMGAVVSGTVARRLARTPPR